MTQPRRDWTDARAKVEEEGQCRVCGHLWNLEAAHIIGREHDRDAGWVVVPLRVVPLCGHTFLGKDGCHQRYDAHELDLMPYLTVEEQARAVLDAGGIELARVRTCPLAYKSEARERGPTQPWWAKGSYYSANE